MRFDEVMLSFELRTLQHQIVLQVTKISVRGIPSTVFISPAMSQTWAASKMGRARHFHCLIKTGYTLSSDYSLYLLCR